MAENSNYWLKDRDGRPRRRVMRLEDFTEKDIADIEKMEPSPEAFAFNHEITGEDMHPYTKGPYYPVLGMVEIDRDNQPDLCSCYPDNYGQGHLLTPEQAMKKAIKDAKFIANACESHHEMLDMLEEVKEHLLETQPTAQILVEIDEIISKVKARAE